MVVKTKRNNLLEAVVWTTALLVLAINDPGTPDRVNLCLIDALGLPFCPGEGLGRAVGYLARGEWHQALSMHWASPLVVVVLIHRIISLSQALTCRK